MLQAVSHLVLATEDVGRISVFFEAAFGQKPHFTNEEFTEFVLPSRFRLAFFKPIGKAAKIFSVVAKRDASSIGVTVSDVDEFHSRLLLLQKDWPIKLSGPPKEHPWGEKSFVLTDPDGNHWEVTQSPSKDGMLTPR